MIVSRRVGQPEPNHHVIQKRRIDQLDPRAAEIIACVKGQLINAGLKKLAREQRFPGAAIGIGGGTLHVTAFAIPTQVQIDDQILRGLAARRIEHMCGKPGHMCQASLLRHKPRQPKGGRASV